MNQLVDTQGQAIDLSSLADWETRKERILDAMQEVMGPLPGKDRRCEPDVRVEEEVDCGAYVRRLISYAAEPGGRVPAYLLIPRAALDRAERRPAVLCPHPTDNRVGHKVVVGLSEKPNRAYASELAERGFVTLAPSYPHLANYWPDLKALGYESGTMKAIWDNIRGIDLLASLPFVEPRFGSVGHSLGGHNSIYTAVFEPRIEVIVSSCGFDSYLDYKDGVIDGWAQERYMPGIKDYARAEIPFDFHDLIAALAPRPCFVSAPLHDSNFKWRSVDAVTGAASRVYDLYGAREHLRVEHPDCKHDFPDEMRELAYRLFETHLLT